MKATIEHKKKVKNAGSCDFFRRLFHKHFIRRRKQFEWHLLGILNHLERVLQKRKESVETHEVHMELMDLLKQINTYTASIAKTFFNTCGQN